MFFINKDRVDSDLEKIKEANLTPEQLEKKRAKEKAEQERLAAQVEGWTWKDTLAMTIAIIQVILPFMLVMAAVMALVFMFFVWMSNH
ncbi:MAG: hypothetical protein IKG53_04840 [Solobacterium sp.]|nr:hypothetical protein [Solobacterium sp.]